MEKIHQGLDVRTQVMYRYNFRKRFLDIAISLLLLICCLPLFTLLSITIVLLSGRPVFFTQSRTGIRNKSFTIYKFRTMKVAKQDDNRHKYEWKEGVPDSFLFKTAGDVTVTSIGKFLRKCSMDELPQLLNVLKGDMSIVGPRPEIPAITDLYNGHQAKRLLVKPGITGYAQINGRSEISHGKKIEYDLYYIKNYSLLLDIKIIIATILFVIRGRGAY